MKKQTKRKIFIFIATIVGVVALFILMNLAIRLTSCPPQDKIDEAVSFAKSHGLRTDCVVLMDFSTHSGKPRFWVYDTEKKKVLTRSLCSHGEGKGNTPQKALLSNEIGSKCSSKGMFRIGEEHIMKNYKINSLRLTGLSATNSNAAARGLLIHPSRLARACGFGIYPFYLPLSRASEGCFAIHFNTFKELCAIAKSSNKKMLLYAYE